MENGLVSVIIPTYNREKTICRAIDSVLGQDYSDIEVIVVDDGSVDHTMELLMSYGNKIRILKQQHRGANAARNKGIKAAKGKYIAFHDSDDEWKSNKLSRQMEYMKNHGYRVCYCAFCRIKDKDDVSFVPTDYRNQEKNEAGLLERLRTSNIVGTPTLLIEADIFKNVGLFDEELLKLQDYELVIRIVQKYKIGYVNEALVNVYDMKDNITSNASLGMALQRILEKHSDFLDIPKVIAIYLNNAGMIQTDRANSACLDEIKAWRGDLSWKLLCEETANQYLLDNCVNYLLKIRANEFSGFLSNLKDSLFVIYGAGSMGKKLYQYLAKMNLKPACFAVTENKTGGGRSIVWSPDLRYQTD